MFIVKILLTVSKQVSLDQVFTTQNASKQFQKDVLDARLTATATPHNLGLLYSQQVSILVCGRAGAKLCLISVATTAGRAETFAGGLTKWR